MSKKDFLNVARSKAEEVTLKNGMKINVRKFTRGEFNAILKATSKIEDPLIKGATMQVKLVALTVSVGDEELTENEVAMDMDNDLVNEIGEHVSRVNGLTKTDEDVEGN